MDYTHLVASGIFESRASAEACVDSLVNNGFERDEISILAQQPEADVVVAGNQGSQVSEGVATGVTTGGVIGGTLGLLAGIGVMAVPGVGPFLAAGPIMATLAGIGVGATAGSIAGALAGAGVPKDQATLYEKHIAGGNILVLVHCDTHSQAGQAKTILENNGAENVVAPSELATEIPLTRASIM